MGWDGARFTPDRITNIWATETKPTSTLRYPGLPNIVSSQDHLFAKTNPHSNSVSWSKVSNLTSEDRLLMYDGVDSNFEGAQKLSRLEAELYGYCISSLCYYTDHKIIFSGTNRRILIRIESIIQQLYGVYPLWRNNKTIFTIFYTYSVDKRQFVSDFVNNIGRACDESGLVIPNSIWNLDASSLSIALKSLVLSDGSGKDGSLFGKLGELSAVETGIKLTLPHDSKYKDDLYWIFRKIGIYPALNASKTFDVNFVVIPFCSRTLKLLDYHESSYDLFVYSPTMRHHAVALSKLASENEPERLAGCSLTPFEVSPSEDEQLYDLETEKYGHFVANGYLVHNSGKDITAFNLAIRQCLRKKCTVYYIFPTFRQARRVIWDAIMNDGRRILDFIPKEAIAAKNEQEMKIRFVNGSFLQLVGSNDYNALMGTNPYAAIFSEYALQDPRAYQFLRPILTANDGWALFISTPRGKNFLWDLYKIAENSPQWYCILQTVLDTKHISLEAIEQERLEGIMSEDLIQQEYFCSFSMGVEGSYYLKYLDKLNFNGQIGSVPWQPSYPVHTAWDIGVRDSTSIIFFQVLGNAIHVIDCYENNKEGLEHYIKVIKDRPYQYGTHIAPHDIRVREFSSGMTRLDKAQQLGIDFVISANLSIMDGIEAVRTVLPRCWFDEAKCKNLIKSLENYRQEYDHKRKVYQNRPLHDIHSHNADAMRYLAVNVSNLSQSTTAADLDRYYREAVYGNNDTVPRVFQEPQF